MIPCEIEDTGDGQYHCKYQMDDEGEVDINIMFEDDKGKMVSIRGCPYKATFSKDVKAAANQMTGPAMTSYIQNELNNMLTQMTDSKK